MTLQEAIDLYVQRKRATGMSFGKGYKTYRAFLRAVGNLHLSRINGQHVLQFLSSPKTSVAAFRRKHSLLRRLFDYWSAHGEMEALPMPSNWPAERSSFLPYIYAREEIRRLLRSVISCKNRHDKIHHKTIRAAITMLYATGATVGEIARLANEDVDLPNGFLRLFGSQLKASRYIPIGPDLIRVARQYRGWHNRVGTKSEWFFSRVDGSKISPASFGRYFERLRRKTGIVGYSANSQRPCLRDLRATFAVHQITAWIRRKEDMNLMLPALGAYMGNVCFESSERYLQLAPERFQHALNKLSPHESRMRWREDPGLLEFLAKL